MDGRRRINNQYLCAKAQAGLTLVELLVVLSILALAASVVVLNAPPSRSSAHKAADAFAAELRTAFANAIVEGAPYRLEVGYSDYVVSRFKNGEWERVSRTTIDGAGDDLSFRVEIVGAAADNALALNGEALRLRDVDSDTLMIPIDPIAGSHSVEANFENRRGRWTVAIDPTGIIRMERR